MKRLKLINGQSVIYDVRKIDRNGNKILLNPERYNTPDLPDKSDYMLKHIERTLDRLEVKGKEVQ